MKATEVIFEFMLIFFFLSCSNNESAILIDETKEMVIDENEESDNRFHVKGDTGNIHIYGEGEIDDSYLLVNDITDNRVYLMNKLDGKIIHEWQLKNNLGNDAELLEDGKLLAAMEDENAAFSFGGFGGKIQIINPDNSVHWDYTYSTNNYLSHHDVEMLPNGNVLLIAWEKKTIQDAEKYGYSNFKNIDYIYPDTLVEINPETDEVVWKWNSWDHVIQDIDPSKENYGEVSSSPELIDINYSLPHDLTSDNGNFMHINGIDYDEKKDLIYLSVNFYNEVWVIDHSTTVEEAANSSGGNHNKGGDLLYRFGNPSAYKNEKGERLFFNNHFPNILENNEASFGNMLIYMNGNDGSEKSIVYELVLPEMMKVIPNSNNEPSISWKFMNDSLYSPILGGAIRLSNGNTLITQAGFGYWEVSQKGDVVWQFRDKNLFWRGYAYQKSHPGIQKLNID